MSITTTNPATGILIEEFEPLSADAIENALAAAEEAVDSLRAMPLSDRAAALFRLADLLDERQEALAFTATQEMGKTITAARAEVAKCASCCRYYAEHGPSFLADEEVEIADGRAYVAHLPIGPVLAVMPWNFPFWQVFRFAAPALMAGNPGLLKHASNVPQSALAIEEVIRAAGFPEGAFQTLLIGSGAVDGILRDPRVRAATLTGSGPAGSAVGGTAGTMIKPSLLELGGSDPFIVMPSADIDAAVKAAVVGRTMNNGQSCIAAKRFLVHTDVYDEFRDKMAAAMQALKIGDPLQDDTDVGPLANKAGLDEVVTLVNESVEAGATRVFGAEKTTVEGFEGGYWFAPGMLEDIPEAAPAFREEIFGPVALMHRVPSLEAAIELANDTPFGLGSAIFTQDEADVLHAVRRIDAGSTAVNRIVASDPKLPFGGTKTSGYGRELSKDGMMAFVNKKTVTISGL
ncbi:MAG: NAD-dependent succinate-semialdehyde dehydrogenase [Pseudomonadota bacterium]